MLKERDISLTEWNAMPPEWQAFEMGGFERYADEASSDD